VFIQAKNVPKQFFGWGLGAYDAPPDTLISMRRGLLPISLPFDAFGISKGGPISVVGPLPQMVLRWPFENLHFPAS